MESNRRYLLPVNDIKNTENPILCISSAKAGEELISLRNDEIRLTTYISDYRLIRKNLQAIPKI